MKRYTFLLLLLLIAVRVIAQEATETAPQAGDVRIDDHGIEQVYVPAGCFMMGTSDEQEAYARSFEQPVWAIGRIYSEKPQHEVCLSSGYWLDRYEVTNAAFEAFVADGGYENEVYWSEAGVRWLRRQQNVDLPLQECTEDPQQDQPRVCITWFEAEAYATWRGGALPTEAQWEFAARGQQSLIYPWGDEWNPDFANVVDSTGLTSVGTYPDGVSWVGAHDMSGNAMEWVADWLSNGYETDAALIDPLGPERGIQKVEKGGWWGSNPIVARAAYRHFEDPPTYQDHHIGLRVVTAAE